MINCKLKLQHFCNCNKQICLELMNSPWCVPLHFQVAFYFSLRHPPVISSGIPVHPTQRMTTKSHLNFLDRADFDRFLLKKLVSCRPMHQGYLMHISCIEISFQLFKKVTLSYCSHGAKTCSLFGFLILLHDCNILTLCSLAAFLVEQTLCVLWLSVTHSTHTSWSSSWQ